MCFLVARGPIKGDTSGENISFSLWPVGLVGKVGERVSKVPDGAEFGTFCSLLGYSLAEVLGNNPLLLEAS